MAFQVADDIADLSQDEKAKKEISIAQVVGKERALLVFEEEMRQFKEHLKELDLHTPSFEKMCDVLTKLVHS
jgi:geranylgeranyl pyrophosphate synthase